MTVGPNGIESLRGRRVGIWGTGKEGRAVARLALDRGAEVVLVQDDPGSMSGIEVVSGGRTVTLPIAPPSRLLDVPVDIVVRSPGVSRYRSEIEALKSNGIPVTTITAMWLEDFKERPVIGVTGSKGKSTTATFAKLALVASDVTVGLGGNIGRPVTDFYEGPECDAYVIEVSSFQAAEVTSSPGVGILTLLAADHLDWHDTYDRYVSDKLNLFAHRDSLDLAVNARSTDAVTAADSLSNCRHHPYGSAGAVAVDGDRESGYSIAVEGKRIGELSRVALRGRHNYDNLCGAITGSRLLSGRWPDFRSLARLLEEMPPLGSRLETVAVYGGIEYVDDALASNPAGTIASLEAFEGRPLSLIAGGHVRGTDLVALADALDKREPKGSTVLVYLGDAGQLLAESLDTIGSDVRRTPAKDLKAAVEIATAGVESTGGVVLLSPAAPTPPAEGTYVERSALFRREVESMAGGRC